MQTEIYDRPTDAAQVGERLRVIARSISGEVLHDILAFRLNLRYRPEDYSLGRAFVGQSAVDAAGCWTPDRIAEIKTRVLTRSDTVTRQIAEDTSCEQVEVLFAECQEELRASIEGDGWRSLFPGKRLLEQYARAEGLGSPVVLQNSLIREYASRPNSVALELRQIVEVIAAGGAFDGASLAEATPLNYGSRES